MNPVLTFSPPRRTNGAGAHVPHVPASRGLAESIVSPSGRGTVYWTSTARSALRPVLLYLRTTRALPDKNGELLVPEWACTSLYNAIHKVCFPTIQDTPALRGVLVYHQYGFPQRLDLIAQRCRDRGLFLIENCVNCAFDGPSPFGVGEAGMASIFSLPKMFRTVLGGALVTRDPGLQTFCDEYFRVDEPWIGRLSHAARRLTESRLGPRSPRFNEMVYALSDYGRRALPSDVALLQEDLTGGAIGLRKTNYARLRHEFAELPFFEGLEADVIPYVVPLFGPREFLVALSVRLSKSGWESGVYSFDVARDVFQPRFVPCVPLPVHQGLHGNLDSLIETISSEWRTYDGQR
jgi:hypothetical protein